MINVLDVAIILLVLASGIVGFKRGVFKEAVMTIGFLTVFIISFYLKNPIANWMCLNLPFFNFAGSFKGMTVLNVILYQMIAFLIIFSILMIIFRVVLSLTGLFEKILNATIILGIPSKVFGFILGLIEGYLIMVFVCLVLSYPIFNIGVIRESNVKTFMLEKTPVLSNISKNLSVAIDDVIDLTQDIEQGEDSSKINDKAIDILVNADIVDQDLINRLKASGKLK